MPELPEVQTIANQFHPDVKGRRVVSFQSYWPKQCQPAYTSLQRLLKGARFLALGRRGKQLKFSMEGGAALFIHLRMSGRLSWEPPEKERSHVRAVWKLDNGRILHFIDARKFGRIRYETEPERYEATLGLEPLSPQFTAKRLLALFAGRRRKLKPLLLDQSLIAGLGNIYTDESLFRAGLHPERLAISLTAEETARLVRSIRSVLREGIRHNGTSLDWIYPGGKMQDFLRVYGREGEPCPVCKQPIERLVVMQRGTHVCSRCQPLEK